MLNEQTQETHVDVHSVDYHGYHNYEKAIGDSDNGKDRDIMNEMHIM